MELLETQDPEKKRLIETSERHRREMEREVKELSDKTEKTIKNALIITGALAVGYIIFNQFEKASKPKKTKKSKTHSLSEEDDDTEDFIGGTSVIGRIGERVMTEATFMLLELAKEKLREYLQTKKEE